MMRHCVVVVSGVAAFSAHDAAKKKREDLFSSCVCVCGCGEADPDHHSSYYSLRSSLPWNPYGTLAGSGGTSAEERVCEEFDCVAFKCCYRNSDRKAAHRRRPSDDWWICEWFALWCREVADDRKPEMREWEKFIINGTDPRASRRAVEFTSPHWDASGRPTSQARRSSATRPAPTAIAASRASSRPAPTPESTWKTLCAGADGLRVVPRTGEPARRGRRREGQVHHQSRQGPRGLFRVPSPGAGGISASPAPPGAGEDR